LHPFQQLLLAKSELRTLPPVRNAPFGGFDFESLRMAPQERGSFHDVKNVIRETGNVFIAAYLQGDIATAKKQVYTAYLVAKVADPAARVRYASMYGTGQVEQHRYREALGPLNEAIRIADKTRDMAHPTIAIYAKIEALSALGDNQQALSFVADEMQRATAHHLVGHLLSYTSREPKCLSEWANGTRQSQICRSRFERARGRIEAQALSHHEVVNPHQSTPAELRLTSLNLQLLDADDPTRRGNILNAIYATEQQLGDDPPPAAEQPIALAKLQHDLHPSELFLEYVLDDPSSHVLAVTRNTVRRYTLPAKAKLEQDASQYRAELMKQKTDLPLAQQLFGELLGAIPEFKEKTDVVVVPDGKLHLLPFSALVSSGQYVVSSHTISAVPSGTVLDLLRHRTDQAHQNGLPYLGVAAWISHAPQPTLLASITRAMSGPKRSDLVALPQSQHEVETIASDLPKPSTVLLGGQATETSFKNLPLNRYDVIHLALHGYADPEFSDRSALVFAPETPPTDDGMLQVREIRKLPLNAALVTLSACNTGIGEVGEEGVANIVNAFIEAGARSVVSTLWEMEDNTTSQIMVSFYQHLSRKEPKAEALRQAQLELLRSGDAPYFWAGFELVGEQRR
jgi:CHAT domain-containing protein